MIIVADTSPLNYLALIGYADVLPRLYGEILVPEAVVAELKRSAAPAAVRAFITSPPNWMKIRKVNRIDATIGLGAGETEAISMAVELTADRILVDDRAARRAAIARGINAAGTLTVLSDAAAMGLLQLPEALAKLQATNFRVSPAIINKLLQLDALRSKGQGNNP